MTKDELLNFLSQKQALTAPVQNAAHERYVAQQEQAEAKRTLRRTLLWGLLAAFVVAIVVTAMNVRFLAYVGYLAYLGWGGYSIYNFMQVNNAKNEQIRAAENKLDAAKRDPDYVAGEQDFPSKYYSYWTIDRLIQLVKENRATTLQDVFNVAETQDFQNDQLSLQQQNLDVARSTNSATKISAAANIFTAFNTRK